ncbi:hypothetical protein N431DRAFT_505004 [Stipitochalara longipes BDJ]|nr:hypothetical protein N431DRAFT_505004 [Stipitochalara longipes BDJ]
MAIAIRAFMYSFRVHLPLNPQCIPNQINANPCQICHPSGSSVETHKYNVQIFSRDPLVLYINKFVSQDEIEHLLKISESEFEPSMIYPNGESIVDTSQRVSESAYVPRDDIVRRIEKRARSFQGWRGKNTQLQPMKTQRYRVNGFYNFHYDWDSTAQDGNRVTTFMIYLVGNCTGGGTNFPRLRRPDDPRWCNVIDCEDEEYAGVTFKPIEGSGVFWENMYPNGSFHHGVRHASLPVKSGEKVGLNIWGWDYDWTQNLGE